MRLRRQIKQRKIKLMSSESKTTKLLQGTVARFNSGTWADASGAALPEELIVTGTTHALQCWKDEKPTDVITEHPLPDLDELNNQIPVEEWEKGMDGKPRPLWVLQHITYLLDPRSAESFTFLNSTWGARIAVDRIRDRMDNMRKLRGGNPHPVVKLESRKMKTKFGEKPRPEFTITRWVDMPGGGDVRAIEHKPDLKALAPPTVAEELNDAIPNFGA
jgi:hypothetical protein